jgi:hypothetical protein
LAARGADDADPGTPLHRHRSPVPVHD